MAKSQNNNDEITNIRTGFAQGGYICDPQIATAIYLAQALKKPLLIEGPPGVGKTELARAASEYFSAPLIRLQCYEGLDEAKALYEWQYGKQLLYTQLLRERLALVAGEGDNLAQAMSKLHDFDDVFFSENFLQPRPLLTALRADSLVVLLIDELDKADQEFEAFLLEILSDYQISVPELGTIRATHPPMVFLTSNNTRTLGDALKRRCLHLHIPFPDAAREAEIIAVRVPNLDARLRQKLVAFVQSLRNLDLKKPPAISETIDWARVLVLLNIDALQPEFVQNTLNVLLKFESDIEMAQAELTELLRPIEA